MKTENVIKFDKNIDEHFKIKSGLLTIELTPREIWNLAKDLGYSPYTKYFYELEQGVITSMWYKGVKLVRVEKTGGNDVKPV